MSLRLSAFTALVLCGSGRAASLACSVPQSDAIVVGTQTAMAKGGITGAKFNLSVERASKGNITPWIQVLTVTWDGKYGAGDWTGSPAQRGVWFLQNGTAGGWTFIPAASSGNVVFFPELSLQAYSGVLPAQLTYNPATTATIDQPVLEIAATRPRDPFLILSATSGVNSLSASQAFRYLATNLSGDLEFAGLIGLIQRGDVPALLQVEQTAATLDFRTDGGQQLTSAIGLSFANSEPIGVASLGRMATSGAAVPQLRQAAATALRTIHSTAAVPYLGVLLSNPSAELQLSGAQGIAFFVNGVGVPTPQTMPSLSHLNSRQPSSYYPADTEQHLGYRRGQEASFIAYWQAWWQQHSELHTVN